MIDSPSTSQPLIQSRLNKARIDKWVFLFNLPEAMKKLDNYQEILKNNLNKSSVQFSIKALRVPETTVKAIGQRYASANLYVSSHSKEPFDLFSIRFNVDNQFSNYHTIYSWLNFLHDEWEAIPDPKNVINKRLGLESYWTNIAVVGLDEYNVTKIMFTMTQAFPTKLSALDLDYTRDSEIEVTANFAFSQLHISYPTESIIK